MERTSNGGMLYHEAQEANLCAVHCINTVLQGPFFSEFDLAAIAADLDGKERQVMLEGAATGTFAAGDFFSEESHNVSLGGDFSIQLFNREKNLHEILGGGIVSDVNVMLWRKKNVSVGIVTVTIGSWMVFETFAYTIITLLSSVLLLLLFILSLWSKSASILNRPSPPLPEFHITEARSFQVVTHPCEKNVSCLA